MSGTSQRRSAEEGRRQTSSAHPATDSTQPRARATTRPLIVLASVCLTVALATGCGSTHTTDGETPPTSSAASTRSTQPAPGAAPPGAAPLRSGTVQVGYRNFSIAPMNATIKVVR